MMETRLMRRIQCISGVLATALAGTTFAAAPGDSGFTVATRHEHGAATLSVALDGGRISVRFSSPAQDLLGFERAPRAGAETARVEGIRAVLASGDRVVRWPAEAGCRQTKVAVKAPVWATAGSGAQAHEENHDHDHAHEANARDGGHADYEADYEFSCTAPSRLAHLDAIIRQHLPGGTRLEVMVLTDRQQTQRELAIGQSRIALR